MNKTLLTLAALASFLIPATSTEAQILTRQVEDVFWIIVQGSEKDDSVYVLEKLGGVGVYLYNAQGYLVDSKYFASSDPIFENHPNPWSGPSLFGGKQELEIVVIANLKGGDDFYYNNSYRFAGDSVFCGTGRDTIYAGPRESTVFADYFDPDRKEIFGGGGDDWLRGGAGHDLIRGGDGDDIIVGNDGNDALYGDAGDDDIDGGRGFNWMFGGTGDDTFRADDPANIISDVGE